jgi:uncharacterized protein YbaA (DUF1428 family)
LTRQPLALERRPEEAMSYIDGFIVPIPKSKLADYKTFARQAEAIWKEYGALDYREWISDDVKPGKLTSFPQSVQLKEDEVVGFSWIVYKSRAHRDEVNQKVMADPRMQNEPSSWPFDGKRMIYGGFAPLLEE